MIQTLVELLNGWGRQWAEVFGPLIVQNTVFVLLVLLALHWLRRASARVRALVATVGVVKLVLPPLIPTHWLLGASQTPVPPQVAALLFPFGERSVAGPGAMDPVAPTLEPMGTLLVVWFVIVVILLVRSGLATVRLLLAVRGARRLSDDHLPVAAGRRRMQLWQSEAVTMPLTIGIRPRRIYVPEAWNHWSAANQQAVLRHELAHVERRDGFFQALEILAQAVYFFHPLIHVLIPRLRAYREMACDDASVTPDRGGRLEYSNFLVDLADTALSPALNTASAAMLMNQRSELMNRVTYQVEEGAMKAVSRKTRVLVAAMLLGSILPLSLVFGDTPPPPPQKVPAAEEPAQPAQPAQPAEPSQHTAVPEPAPEPTAETPAVPIATEREVGQPSPVPSAEPAQPSKQVVPPQPPKSGKLLIVIQEDQVLVNGEAVSDKKLQFVLQEATSGDVTPVVALKTESDATMGRLHTVQKELQAAGLLKVMYTGDQDQRLAMVLPDLEQELKLEQLADDMKVDVLLDDAGVLHIDGKKMKPEQASTWIGERLGKNPNLVVELRTETATPYEGFLESLDALKKAGATRIAIRNPGD